MKKSKTLFWYFLLALFRVLNLNAQTYSEDNDIVNCGHLLDGPSSLIKNLENKSLDNLLTISEDQKKEIGKMSYEQIVKNNKIIIDFENREQIIQTFNAVKEKASHNIDFQLHVIESEDINAFTMLGGHIYLTSALLKYIESIDELAFILGHEIGHNVHFHSERKIKKIMLASTFLGAFNVDEFVKIAIDINHKFSAPFDQINEYKADKYGFEVAKAAGYNVNKFADFFKKMEKYEKRSIFNKLNSTHPFSSDRRRCLESYLAQ